MFSPLSLSPSLPPSLSLSLHIWMYPVSAGVTASPVSSAVSEGSTVEFEFMVRGYPLPTVEWYKGTIGDTFRINLDQQLTSGKSYHQLSVSGVFWYPVASESVFMCFIMQI